jgi:hypothetical protein
MIIDKSPEDWEDADSWTVTNHKDCLSFYTCIANFDLVNFLTQEGFKLEDVDQDG